tara:strand:+ start:830 stop:1420 length:591 start_codon:yes stop_codon:yes gene_type:complete
MDYIAHRINTIKQLKLLDNKYGIEIDIRDDGKDLIIVHDPFKKGIKLEKFLKFYNHKIIIANIKSERIEDRVIKVFKEHKIYNYFFLDTSVPKIIELVKQKFKKIALRVSYYEDILIAQKLKGKVNWIWFDTFRGLPKDLSKLKYLKNKLKYKICLVCPKLHDEKNQINSNKIKLLKKNGLIDAVCTKEKFFDIWK